MPVDDLPASELPDVAQRCSNIRRWGAADESGTLNLITPAKRREAAALVCEGISIPIGRVPRRGLPGVQVDMTALGAESAWTCRDRLTIDTHSPGLTHLDALGHVYLDGKLYNERDAAEMVTSDGLHFADVHALRDGIFTRGVLLDICAVRGVRWLPPGSKIYSADLDAAERNAGVKVEAGDAVLVHSGIEQREMAQGAEDPTTRPGLAAEAISWIHERDVAVYSGDCFEALPSGYRDHPLPLHMIGSSQMGLVILDNPTMTELVPTCARLGRHTFLMTCAPLPIPGSTGSPVNPLALF